MTYGSIAIDIGREKLWRPNWRAAEGI